MKLYSRSGAWIEKIKTVLRGQAQLDEKMLRRLAKASPPLAMGIRAAEALEMVHAFVRAREDMVCLGGQFFERVFEFHLQDLAKALESAHPTTRMEMLHEIQAYASFTKDRAGLLKLVPNLKSVPQAFSEADQAILAAVREEIVALEGPKSKELRRAWAHFLDVVPAQEIDAWKGILQKAHDAREGFQSRRVIQKKTEGLNDRTQKGYLTGIRGQLFEEYARRSPEMAGAFSRSLAGAQRKAEALKKAMPGTDWKALRTGKLELKRLSRAEVAQVRATGVVPSGFLEFADESMAAVHVPARKTAAGAGPAGSQAVGGIDFQTLFQFKSTSRPSRFLEQNVNDLLRLWDGLDGSQILAKFKHPETGQEVYCFVRQASASAVEEPLTMFRVGGGYPGLEDIPSSKLLTAAGVKQEALALSSINQEDIFNLAEVFFDIAGRLP